MKRADRAAIHRALGDVGRLGMVDELSLCDRTPQELARLSGLETNLLAHHLDVLEEAGLIRRKVSSGDRRRRYISLDCELIHDLLPRNRMTATSVIFVCTHNSARSQFAEALMRSRCSIPVQSAGPYPSPFVHPKAITVGREMGVDVSGRKPKGYAEVRGSPDLLVSVCDVAFEAATPFGTRRLHWSIADPVATNRVGDFRSAFMEIQKRVGQLVEAIENERQRT